MFLSLRGVFICVLLWPLKIGRVNRDFGRRLISASPLPPGEGHDCRDAGGRAAPGAAAEGEGINNEIVGKEVAPTSYRC